MRRATGYVYKREDREGWWSRLTYTDVRSGKRRNLVRYGGRTKAEARERLSSLQRELQEQDGRTFDRERATFAELCSHYEELYVKAPEYRNGVRISGIRSVDSTRSRLRTLGDYFGRMRLRSLTYGDLVRYKEDRLTTPTPRGLRSGTTVNRELMLLRRLMNIAEQDGWIPKSPFRKGLIDLNVEQKRELILTRDQEARLIGACDEIGRTDLRAMLICALDTGMRQGEMLSLRWSDVDFEARVITLRAFSTKTERVREVPISDRLLFEMKRIRTQSSHSNLEERIFGIVSNVKRSFARVRTMCGLDSLRFHDLRHTAATRFARLQIPLRDVGALLGHTRIETTMRYVNSDRATLDRALLVLNRFHSSDGEYLDIESV